jgi:DNA-directed RNA polymerase specialized sigma24 family protein
MANADGGWSGITRDQFTRALDSLPADFRAVFELRAYGEAYDQIADQIAARLAISREVVSARLRLARALLTDLLMPARLA